MNDLDPIEAGQPSLDPPADTSAETPVAPSAPPTLAEQLYEVKYGGQTRKVSLNELQSGYSRTQDYTQKTMALAEERRQIEARSQAERTQIREFLSKTENVKQLLDYLNTQNPQADPTQQGQPLTVAQLQAALAAERQRQVGERNQMVQDFELKQTESAYRQDLDQHIKAILEQHPELKSVRRIDLILKQAAAENDPATIEEAKQYMLQAAAEQAEAIRAHFTQQQKVAQTTRQNLVTKGTEPPGGGAPMPAAKSPYKLGDTRLNQDAAEYLKSLMGADK